MRTKFTESEVVDSQTSAPKVVCLLDVLGFEMRLRTLGLTALKAKYDQLIDYVKRKRHGFDLVSTPDGHLALGVGTSGYAYFSDSLLFWQSYFPPAFSGFAREIAEAICVGLELELPLRGAIAIGEAVLDEDKGVFVGAPLIEVSRIEKIQRWIGASFGPSFNDQRFSRYDPQTVFPYEKHYKKEDQGKPIPREWMTGITIDWPRRWRETRQSSPHDTIERLRDDEHGEIYDAAEAFVAESGAHNDWFLDRMYPSPAAWGTP
jgi:hypothetical protein